MEILFEQIWFKKGFNNYKPNRVVIENVSKHINKYTIHIYLVLDCEDVQSLIPKLFKVLSEASFQSYKIEYVEKQNLPYYTLRKEKITKVPTIIFYNKKNIEKGRITESIRIMPSVEGEVLQIINY